MPAVGLTDHGTVAGAIEFIKTCREEKIKPILGSELYFCRNHKVHNKDGQPDARRGNRHLNVIAKNYQGYQNLCALSHTSCIDGYYYDPRIDFELLNKHKEGIVVTSACLSNIINWNLSIDRYEHAKNAAGMFKEVFGDDFYLEMMYHGIDEEAKILPEIQKLSQELDIKIICTNDCHYLKKQDAEFHEIVMCMSSRKTLKDPKRLKFPYKEFYFKSSEEMSKIFNQVSLYMQNTMEIVEKCDYSDIILHGQMLLPKFDLPPGQSNSYDYLCKLAWEGIKKLELHDSKNHVDRLTMELSDIKLIYDTKRYDFATYFLIVHDIMEWSRKNDISAGVRGSGFGSLLLQCIGVTDSAVDILSKNLYWERFLGFDMRRFISEDDFGIK